ncbi:uncharacterized protein [Misgurnus anguillicaudatus]|uniref:uncharacterized protein n=1 Tax=Misgurnus anguillicaudatus TaxID=75329 RepID=UPI003CCF7BBE
MSKSDTGDLNEQNDDHLETQSEGLRRSKRNPIPTEKMLYYQREELQKKEKKITLLYDKWKIEARRARERLKTDITMTQLAMLIDDLEAAKTKVLNVYDEIRQRVSPTTEMRRKIDACEAVTADVIKIIHERISGIDGDFDAGRERERLQTLLSHQYARSIFGSTVSRISQGSSKHSSQSSVVSSLAAKRVEAAADLAAKQVAYESLLEEENCKERIQLLEEQHKRAVDAELKGLQRIQAQKDLKAAQAKVEVYDNEIEETLKSSSDCSQIRKKCDTPQVNIKRMQGRPMSQNVAQADLNVMTSQSVSQMPVSASILQDSLAMSRLPVPEPSVFTGDPIRFIEWKSSFTVLIERKCISSAEKLFYLKKYVSDSVSKALEGIFFRTDDDAYSAAWDKLNCRYGQPFTIQKAFREKLANWPKIQVKDATGLRNFSDFLSACENAMPHVNGLQILNDYQENQKLVQKLPDWAASRWNRQVTQALSQNQEFPSFKEFSAFVSAEADIACNPVTSFQAFHALGPFIDKFTPKDIKRNKVQVFNTQMKSVRPVIKNPCLLCEQSNHQLNDCFEFRSKSLEERRKFVQEQKLCYGCLKSGHIASECRYRLVCDNCKRKHPTCLHDNNFIRRVKSVPSTDSSQGVFSGSTNAVTLSVIGEGQTTNTSMILPVWISTKQNPNCERLVYALLDSQSDTTFVDQEVSNALQAQSSPVKLRLTTMLGIDSIVQSERVSGLQVRAYESDIFIDLPPTYTRDYIPVNRDHIPTCEIAKKWNHLSSIADKVPPLKDCEIGLLIGYNCPRSMAPREVIVGKDDEPFAVRTDLGWSIVGCSSPRFDLPKENSLCHRLLVKELPHVTPTDVIRVLESDFKDINEEKMKVSQDDILFLKILKESICQNKYGHYEMPLPFKERPILPSNKQLATARLDHLKRKMSKDEMYKERYKEFMSEIIQRGDAEEVSDCGKEGETWYLPHHGVFHPKKPNKLRVVFDCSATYNGCSLNEHLLQGPDMINNLTGILIRFRQHPVALMCDVEKMYHQFHVSESDRDYMRFLWWKNGECDQKPLEFRMKVHIFGATSSSGCANFGLKYIANKNSHLYPLGSEFVLRNFYVDDGVTSLEDTETAIKGADEARKLCATGGLRLHKFMSNDKAVLNSIPASELASDVKDFAFDSPVERALGIQWQRDLDCFQFKIKLQQQPATRRGILSTVASVYDPLGFVAPVLLNGKRILQEVCKRGTGWDDSLSTELQLQWEQWKQNLSELQEINIPRTYAPTNFGKIVMAELHHFSDASTQGYGQCSYLRLRNENGNIHCALVMAKSRISPLKVVTIPRLELTAAVTSVEVSNVLKGELDYAGLEESFWTDSKVVMGYIRNEARRFHTFVANRVQRIQLRTTPQQWRYVPSKENPADHASRGLNVQDLQLSNWFSGPKFLWERDLPRPTETTSTLSLDDPEVKAATVLKTEGADKVSWIDRLSKFSSWSQAIRAVARLMRRISKDRSNHLSTVVERQKAELHIIKCLQGCVYRDELKRLKKSLSVLSHSELYPLDSFIDENGVLKVGGRLRHSDYPDSLKHPAIIPRNHFVTKMIIAHCHEKVKHQGKGFTVNEIRSHGYWIPGIGRTVASYIRRCVACRKFRRPTEIQKMADLPSERVNPSPPFTYTGLDCFGPFLVKRGRSECKRYGLLLTCLCSRAVHIEMLTDMTTDSFINALRCFIAIRGTVQQIRSDQGTNFVGAKNEFKKALEEVDTERVTAFLSEKQCDFVMNAPHASHAGGVWERQIRTVRSVLNSILSTHPVKLDDASLRTFLYEAMAIVNSRPLTVDV